MAKAALLKLQYFGHVKCWTTGVSK